MPVLTEFFGVLPALLGRYQNMLLSRLMRDTLHWLPAALQRISYRIAVLVWRCLLGSAPAYLWELCSPVSCVSGRRALRSSVSGQLLVPGPTIATIGSVAHFPWLAPPHGLGSPWRSASCLRIVKMRSASYLRLTDIIFDNLWMCR